VSAVKSFLGISSPSKLFAEIGVDTGEGLIKGFAAMGPKIAQEALAMSNALVENTNPNLASGLSLSSSASGGGATGAGSVTYVQQTNVMQPGADVLQFGNAVLQNAQYDHVTGGSLRGVTVGSVQAGMASPDFVPGVRSV
jgi:hypothetical protein